MITPNNGSHEFTSITLNVAGTLRTFSGGVIVGNGSQRDNVFVAVPAGYSADDLRAGGSSAEITDAARRTKFVLSHVCLGEAEKPVFEDEPVAGQLVSIDEAPTIMETAVAAPALMAEELGTATTISAQPYRRLPATGTSMNLAIIATAMILFGGTASLAARRRDA